MNIVEPTPVSEAPIFISEAESAPTGDGPLRGWRLAIKDNIDVEGMRTTGGTRFLRAHVADADAEVVRRVRSAGATIVGKTNLHELGHGITGINPTFGTTLHPENPRYTVGGSSGGSALAVASGKARAALGTDTGGSARIPAAYAGLVGFRPSHGRYPHAGVLRISPSRDTVGVLARTVADVSRLDAVLGGRLAADGVVDSPQPATPTVGVLRESVEALPAALREAFEGTLDALGRAGIPVRLLDASRDLDRYFALGIVVLNAETIAAVEEYLRPRFGPGAIHELVAQSESPDTREILRMALERPVAETEYRTALEELLAMGHGFRRRMNEQDIDVIAYPTTSSEPPTAVARDAVDVRRELEATVLNSTPATLARTPAITLPAGRSPASGLPVGLTLEHLGRRDDVLLGVAATLEPIVGAVEQ